MSLAIDVDKVTRVMIGNQWHEVAQSNNCSSFDLDAYEIHQDRHYLLHGGQERLIPAVGFSFTTLEGRRITGPLTSLQAIEEDRRA